MIMSNDLLKDIAIIGAGGLEEKLDGILIVSMKKSAMEFHWIF